MPTPQGLAHTKTLASFGDMRYALMQVFPDSFGGLYNDDGQEGFVILVVGGAEQHAAIQSYAAKYLKQASPNDSVPTSITYASAVHSLSSLFALRDKIFAATQGGAKGLPQVLAVGINDKDNVVQVNVPRTVSVDAATTTFQTTDQSEAKWSSLTLFTWCPRSRPALLVADATSLPPNTPVWQGEQLATLRRQGRSPREIGERYGCSVTTVERALRRYGLVGH